MSATSTRLRLDQAVAVARNLTKVWALGSDCLWTGSLRRGKPDVGDLDLVAALPPEGGADTLLQRIDATLDKQGALFGAAKPIGIALKGHKPHFRQSNYDTRWTTKAGTPLSVLVNVFRYQPGNKGWTIIRTTGPDLFGIMFLSRWKDRFGIRHGDEHKASIGGHLVDSHRVAVPAESEEEAFRLAGWTFVDPKDRERIAAHWARSTNHPSSKEFPS